MASPCKQSTSWTTELLELIPAEVLTGCWEYFDIAFLEHITLPSLPPGQVWEKKTAITVHWKRHELYFKWERKETVAHRSLKYKITSNKAVTTDITLYCTLRGCLFFPLLLLWADTNWYFILVLYLWHEKWDFKTEWTLMSGTAWD